MAAFEVKDRRNERYHSRPRDLIICGGRLAEQSGHATWCKTTNMVAAVSACFDCSAQLRRDAMCSDSVPYKKACALGILLGRSECSLWERRSEGASLGVDRPRTDKTVLSYGSTSIYKR